VRSSGMAWAGAAIVAKLSVARAMRDDRWRMGDSQ
jgi:hypothetical protein